MLKLKLPYPPSVNRYWRNVKGRTLISKAGREYRKQVKLECLLQKPMRLNGFLKVTVYMCPPDRRRRDVDNISKALFDSMKHAGVYEDDYQIEDMHIIRRRETTFPGCVEVDICES